MGCFSGGLSFYGCEEMSGNVLECCLTKWRSDYTEKADETADGKSSRVLRGGAFYAGHPDVRCAYRYDLGHDLRFDHLGFRVVLSPLL
jgi:formylglycine-generating enzyme required for sulfatase activity